MHNGRVAVCPTCECPLVVYELGGVEIDHCLECRGTWLDAGELQQMGERAGAALGRLEASLARPGGPRHGTRRCARCGRRLRMGEVAGVKIDLCPRGHGLWLDRGELGTLLSSFSEGADGAVAGFLGEILRWERVR